MTKIQEKTPYQQIIEMAHMILSYPQTNIVLSERVREKTNRTSFDLTSYSISTENEQGQTVPAFTISYMADNDNIFRHEVSFHVPSYEALRVTPKDPGFKDLNNLYSTVVNKHLSLRGQAPRLKPFNQFDVLQALKGFTK